MHSKVINCNELAKHSIVHAASSSNHPLHCLGILLIATKAVTLRLTLRLQIELTAADVSIFLAREVFTHVLLAQEVRLPIRLDHTLVLVIFAFQLAGRLRDQKRYRNHNALVSDATD